jgi:hypothetical protein
MSDWMPADQAYNHVLAIEIVPDTTRKKLTDQIKRGELPARDHTGSVVPASFWNTGGQNAGIEFDFAKGTATRKDYPISGPANAIWEPNNVQTVKGLEFSAKHLFTAWPNPTETQPDGQASSPVRKDPRGARLDLRWESILIEAARFMYSKQEAGKLVDVIAHVRKWLNEPNETISDTSLKEHLSPLWRAFKEVDGG